MAARTLYRDHSNENAMLSQAASLEQEKANTLITESSAKHNEKSLTDYNDYLDKMKTYNAINLGLDLTKLAINTASDIYGIVKQSQSAEGANVMAQSFEE